MTVYEMALRYYPRLWGRERIQALAEAGRLTQTEAEEIMEAAQSVPDIPPG